MNQNKIKILYIIDRLADIYGCEKYLLEPQGLNRNLSALMVVALNPNIAPEIERLAIQSSDFKLKRHIPLLIQPFVTVHGIGIKI